MLYYRSRAFFYTKFSMRELTHEVTHEQPKQYTATLSHAYLGALRHHTYTKKPRETWGAGAGTQKNKKNLVLRFKNDKNEKSNQPRT